MQSQNSSALNQRLSQATKPTSSATSGTLTRSEVESLLRSAKEASDFGREAFSKTPLV
jgi:hypothetical protein